ncbi:MAG: hypothetical protein AB1792_03415 [Candidatus Zixiibacteriota bacterium]
MIVQTFTGPSVRMTLDRVRAALGADAMILDTQTGDGLGTVRITAAVEPKTPPEPAEGPKSLHIAGALATNQGEEGAAASPSPADGNGESLSLPWDAWQRPLRDLIEAVGTLRRHGGQDSVWLLLREWLATQHALAGGIIEAFATHLAESLPPAEAFLETRPTGMTVLLVGGRGVGRSTALFQASAVRWRHTGRRPRLAVISDSLDHAQERLATWCERGELEFSAGAIGDSRFWKELRQNRREDLFVEYAPSARHAALTAPAKIIRRNLKPDVVAQVLAATGSPQAWRNDCQRFLPFRASHLLVTRWDEMQPWWAVYSMARDSGLLPSYRTSGTDPVDDITAFTATDLRVGLAEHLAWEIHLDRHAISAKVGQP